MDELQKTRIRLAHWVDHNLDHLTGYEEAATALDRQGPSEAATKIREAVKLIQAANDKLKEALATLPSSEDTAEHSHGSHGHCHRCDNHHH